MGSVADLTRTGDNDPEIYPVEYYRHYMYCDKCGSFKLEAWIEPENHPQLARTQSWIGKASTLTLYATVFAAITGVIWGTPDLLSGSVLDFVATILLLAVPLLFLSLGLMKLEDFVGSKIKDRGVRCGACSEDYKNGSHFFIALEKNPKNYTMEDVPLPRNSTYWIRGKTVEK